MQTYSRLKVAYIFPQGHDMKVGKFVFTIDSIEPPPPLLNYHKNIIVDTQRLSQ